jgi:hypothetical protein
MHHWTPAKPSFSHFKNGRKSGSIADHEWKAPKQHAFKQLIDAPSSAPVLRHYDPSLPVRMETDASSTACAGMLSLKWEDGWDPIAYCSKRLLDPEFTIQLTIRSFPPSFGALRNGDITLNVPPALKSDPATRTPNNS